MRRSLLWPSGIGSVLIVAGIIGVSVALFSAHRSSAYPAIGSAGGTPVTREVEAGGLAFRMQLTPGPLDRRISLLSDGAQVWINGPTGALAHLYYIYTVTCDAVEGGGTVGSGNFAGMSISTTMLREPDCGDEGTHTVVEWAYAVSAPGYSIASGRNR